MSRWPIAEIYVGNLGSFEDETLCPMWKQVLGFSYFSEQVGFFKAFFDFRQELGAHNTVHNAVIDRQG